MQSTPENRLFAEWQSAAIFGMSDRSWSLLDQLGITMEHMLTTGYLGFTQITARGHLYQPAPSGQWAFVLPVFDPAPPGICEVQGIDDWALINLAAFMPRRPERFYIRIDRYDQTNALDPHAHHETPYNWIMADGEGSCHVKTAALEMIEELRNGR